MAYEIECTMQPHGRYVARVVDHEGESPKGEGATKTEALCELIEGLLDARSDAIGMAFGALIEADVEAYAAENPELRMDASSVVLGMQRATRTVEGVF